MKNSGITFPSVDSYISFFPSETQTVLEALRKTVKKAAPKAAESISYNMPSYNLNGVLVNYAAYKRHIGFYPRASGVAEFKKELAGYKITKGTIHFPLDQPMPLALISQIVRFRVYENNDRAVKAPKKPSKSKK